MSHMLCRNHYKRLSVTVCLGPSRPWTWGRQHDSSRTTIPRLNMPADASTVWSPQSTWPGHVPRGPLAEQAALHLWVGVPEVHVAMWETKLTPTLRTGILLAVSINKDVTLISDPSPPGNSGRRKIPAINSCQAAATPDREHRGTQDVQITVRWPQM